MPGSNSLLSFAPDVTAASPFLGGRQWHYILRDEEMAWAESLVTEVREYEQEDNIFSRILRFAFKMKYIVSSQNIKI